MSDERPATPWRSVHLARIYRGEVRGQLRWAKIIEPRHAARLGLQVVANGRRYEFRQRGGCQVRPWSGPDEQWHLTEKTDW